MSTITYDRFWRTLTLVARLDIAASVRIAAALADLDGIALT